VTVPLRSYLSDHGPVVAIWDGACGKCHPCKQGLPARCAAPLEPGTDLDRWHERAVAEVVDDQALCAVADAVWAVGLLIEWRELSPVVRAVGNVPSREVVAAAVKPLSSPVDRRADVVIALDGDLAAASLQVRRGGAIGATCEPTKLPSYTAMVQRELEVLIPSDVLEAFALADLDGVIATALRTVSQSHAS
jgi:hypothetical protein